MVYRYAHAPHVSIICVLYLWSCPFPLCMRMVTVYVHLDCKVLTEIAYYKFTYFLEYFPSYLTALH